MDFYFILSKKNIYYYLNKNLFFLSPLFERFYDNYFILFYMYIYMFL